MLSAEFAYRMLSVKSKVIESYWKWLLNSVCELWEGCPWVNKAFLVCSSLTGQKPTTTCMDLYLYVMHWALPLKMCLWGIRRPWRPRSDCAYVQSDLGLQDLLFESLDIIEKILISLCSLFWLMWILTVHICPEDAYFHGTTRLCIITRVLLPMH